MRDVGTSGMSVYQNMSHAGIESKVLNRGLCGLHHRLAYRNSKFFDNKFHTIDPIGTPLPRASNETGMSKKDEKLQIFDQRTVSLLSRKRQ